MGSPRKAMALTALCAALSACGNSNPNAIPVVVSLPEETARLAAATILVDYSATGASMARDGNGPECAFISPFVTGNFTDDGSGRLTLRARSTRGFSGPIDLAACRMVPADPETEARIITKTMKVKVVKAQDNEGKEIDPRSRQGARVVADAALELPAASPADLPGGDTAKKGPPAGDVQPEGAKGGTTGPPAPKPAVKPATPNKPTVPAPPAAAPPAAPTLPPGADAGAQKTAAERVRERIAANNPLGTKAGPSAAPPAAEPADEPGTAADNYDDSPGFSPGLPEYEITVSIVDNSAELGALQFEIDHLGSSGGFISTGGRDTLDCLILGGMLGAVNKKGRSAKVGIIDLDGIPETGPIVTCGFRSAERIATGSFNVRVIDAGDTSSNPVAFPLMAVTTIVPR